MKKITVTVTEHITEAFGLPSEGEAFDDWLAATVEDIRVNGDDKRQFVSVDDVTWEINR